MSEAGPANLPMAEWPEVHCIAGAHETVAALHRDYPLCIATNASVSRRPMIERALERVGLHHYFSDVFCFTEIGHRKETPEFWEVVSRTLGFPLHELAMVGDTLEADVLAPRRSGVFSVWFNQDGHQPAAACSIPVITRLTEFVTLVQNHQGGRRPTGCD
ncbi:MAG: HAD family hydrolase [Myxococcota bacterium]